MSQIFDIFQGRTTFFAAFFALAGTTFHALHLLNTTYIQFVAVIMGYVVAHSAKEDIVAHFNTTPDKTETTVSTTQTTHP